MMNYHAQHVVAVKVATGPTITLMSGAEFDFLNPWNSDFGIDDVAHALGNICRYAGHCSGFYSVAEHSLHVSDVAVGFELEALLHDAAEAFLGDVTRPLKQLLPDYKRIEREVTAAVFNRFGVSNISAARVKEADLRVLAAEQRQIMPPGTDDWADAAGVVHAPITVRFMPPRAASEAFMARYRLLAGLP